MATAVIPDAGMSEMIALILASELKLRLAKASITLGKATVIGDFVECDFGGYAAASISWGSVSIDGSHNALSVITPITFTRSGSGSDNTVYAWYVTNSGGSVLYAGRTLTVPVPMNSPGSELTIAITQYQGDL